jgi:hypothetical protein
VWRIGGERGDLGSGEAQPLDNLGEWFELFNPGTTGVDIKGWIICVDYLVSRSRNVRRYRTLGLESESKESSRALYSIVKRSNSTGRFVPLVGSIENGDP